MLIQAESSQPGGCFWVRAGDRARRPCTCRRRQQRIGRKKPPDWGPVEWSCVPLCCDVWIDSTGERCKAQVKFSGMGERIRSGYAVVIWRAQLQPTAQSQPQLDHVERTRRLANR